MDNNRSAKSLRVSITFSVLFLVSAILTLVPWPLASHANLLGYDSFCSYSPISTTMLLITSFAFASRAAFLKLARVRS